MPNQEFATQVSESIKLVYDLTSRIDERVKQLIDQQAATQDKIERIAERQENMSSRLAALESQAHLVNYLKLNEEMKGLEVRMTSVEIVTKSQANTWERVVDMLFKVGVAIVSAITLWKLGVK